MTEFQLAAIRRPALLAEETMYPDLGHVLPKGTLVLSVNAGFE